MPLVPPRISLTGKSKRLAKNQSISVTSENKLSSIFLCDRMKSFLVVVMAQGYLIGISRVLPGNLLVDKAFGRVLWYQLENCLKT